jgi:RNA polymerase sigma-32 factor
MRKGAWLPAGQFHCEQQARKRTGKLALAKKTKYTTAKNSAAPDAGEVWAVEPSGDELEVEAENGDDDGGHADWACPGPGQDEDCPPPEAVSETETVSDTETHSPPPATASLLQRYLWEIRQYPILSREEEAELAQKYFATGDSEAAARLVTSNLRLVVKIAMEHQSYWSRNLLDLVQEGNLGLIQALKKFDPFRGIKFSYYASFWITAYILKYIMDNWRLVRLGTTQSQRKLFYNLNREKEKLLSSGIVPETKLLSTRLGVSEREVLDMEQRLGSWEVSLDAPLSDEADSSAHSFLPSTEPLADEVLADDQLRRAFRRKLVDFERHLDDKEKVILQKRLLSENPATLNDLGLEFGVSRERVRQLQERLLKKLKNYMEKEITGFARLFADLAESD